MLPRRLLEMWQVTRESRWNQTCSIFSETVWRLFQVSSLSRRCCGDVAATKYVFYEEDVSITSPRPARDQRIEEKLRQRLRDMRKCLCNFAATSPQQCLTYFYRPGKEIIKENLQLAYTCKTWYMMYIDKIYRPPTIKFKMTSWRPRGGVTATSRHICLGDVALVWVLAIFGFTSLLDWSVVGVAVTSPPVRY